MSILILGTNGLAGSAVKRYFVKYTNKKIFTIGSRRELDLRNFKQLESFFFIKKI